MRGLRDYFIQDVHANRVILWQITLLFFLTFIARNRKSIPLHVHSNIRKTNHIDTENQT